MASLDKLPCLRFWKELLKKILFILAILNQLDKLLSILYLSNQVYSGRWQL